MHGIKRNGIGDDFKVHPEDIVTKVVQSPDDEYTFTVGGQVMPLGVL